jgi:hypothetical protein
MFRSLGYLHSNQSRLVRLLWRFKADPASQAKAITTKIAIEITKLVSISAEYMTTDLPAQLLTGWNGGASALLNASR